MGKADQVSSIFWLIFGLAVIFKSYQLGLGALASPGPGFISFWSGVILCGLSVVVFSQGKLDQRAEAGGKISQLWTKLSWPKSVYVIISLVAYELSFTYLGFMISTMVLLIFLFKVIEPETWLRAAANSILISVISYILFGIWLQVQLPRGFLENLIF